jgi:hypothetical protein
MAQDSRIPQCMQEIQRCGRDNLILYLIDSVRPHEKALPGKRAPVYEKYGNTEIPAWTHEALDLHGPDILLCHHG